MIDVDQLYLVREVASILRCGKTNVYDLLSSGDLAKISIGSGKNGLRVKGSDILAFLDGRREGGPQPKGTPRGTFKYLKI